MAGVPSTYKPEYCDRVIELLSAGKSIAAICSKLDIGRQTLYDWKSKYPEFAYALDRGVQKSQEYWEEIGYDGIVGNLEKFSAPSWVYLMKCRFHQDYSEKKEETISNTLIEKLIDKL